MINGFGEMVKGGKVVSVFDKDWMVNTNGFVVVLKEGDKWTLLFCPLNVDNPCGVWCPLCVPDGDVLFLCGKVIYKRGKGE